jgi:hypothetical protein
MFRFALAHKAIVQHDADKVLSYSFASQHRTRHTVNAARNCYQSFLFADQFFDLLNFGTNEAFRVKRFQKYHLFLLHC